jgi:hypothetical protein
MSLPGFTAESSIYRSSRRWRAASGGLGNKASCLVIPQAIGVLPPNCFTSCEMTCRQGCLLLPWGDVKSCCDVECCVYCANQPVRCYHF